MPCICPNGRLETGRRGGRIGMMSLTLNRRALNRATLARQMLLTREKTTPLRAIERLMGLQAQLARPPFIGLWSRIENFQPEALTRALLRREVVRALMMRCTLHLMSGRDYLKLRATFQPVLDRAIDSSIRERAKALDMELLLGPARQYLDEEPCTLNELRARLRKRFPKYDEQTIGYAVRTHLPLVQV